MRLQDLRTEEQRMLTQTSTAIYAKRHENGRFHHNTPHPSMWTSAKSTPRKNGTLALDQSAYGLPENDLPGIIPLHLNENLFNAAKTAVNKNELTELLTTHLDHLHSYPINGVKQLQDAIADHLNIDPAKVVLSTGSSVLLRQLIFYLLKKDDTILMPAPSWSFYKAATALVQANIDTFPLLDLGDTFVYDKNLIAAKIELSKPKVVLICSPNNPTGNVMPIRDFLWLVHQYPHVDFILDEAYYGFQNVYSSPEEQKLLASSNNKNLFIVRTFSKFYGLANLRIGFLICSKDDAQNLQKIAPVFGLPSLNQALAAHRLANKSFQAKVQLEYAGVKAYMFNALNQIPGFAPYKTYANFILIRHDARWSNLDELLLNYGYKIKRETIYGARNYLRITLADIATMENLIAVMRQLAKRETAVYQLPTLTY